MRNEKLRNKLNDIPQDFDREQLWSSIDLPKKKRKRRGFFWLFLLGIVALGAFSISIFNNQKTTSQLSTVGEEYEVNESESKKMNSAVKSITQDSESMISSNSSQAKTNSIGLEKIGGEKIDESTEIQKNTNRQSLTNDYNKDSDHQLNIQKSIRPSGLNPSESESTNSTILNPGEIDIISNVGNDNTYKNSEKSDREAAKFVFLLPLPYIIHPLPNEHKFELRIDQNESVKDPTSYKHGIAFFALVGKSNHDFGNSLIRTVNETSLETISLGVLGQFRMNNFELFPGFSFIKHNTLLNQEAQTTSLVNGVNGLIRKTTTTEYALYNSYQYIDANLGIGYVLSLGRKWSIRPSVHGSYTLSFDTNGDLINQNDDLLDLSNLDEYKNYSKWQGRFQFMISREMNENWEVGILTYLSTSKSLSNSENLLHDVSSQGVGITISRYFR